MYSKTFTEPLILAILNYPEKEKGTEPLSPPPPQQEVED